MDLSCELQKIPNLLSHYQEHKSCNDNSFLKFLLDDYLNLDGDSQQAHHDDNKHEDLPFNGKHQCCSPSVFYTSEQEFSVMAPENSLQTEIAFYGSFHSSEYIESPFQPPQV